MVQHGQLDTGLTLKLRGRSPASCSCHIQVQATSMLVANVSPENRGEVFTSSDVNYSGVATEVENGSHWAVRLLHAPAPPRRTGLVPKKTVSLSFSN